MVDRVDIYGCLKKKYFPGGYWEYWSKAEKGEDGNESELILSMNKSFLIHIHSFTCSSPPLRQPIFPRPAPASSTWEFRPLQAFALFLSGWTEYNGQTDWCVCLLTFDSNILSWMIQMWLQRSYIRCQALGWHCPKPDHSCIEELWGNSPGFTEPSQPLQKNNIGSKFPGSLCFGRLIAKLLSHSLSSSSSRWRCPHSRQAWPMILTRGIGWRPVLYTCQPSINIPHV